MRVSFVCALQRIPIFLTLTFSPNAFEPLDCAFDFVYSNFDRILIGII